MNGSPGPPDLKILPLSERHNRGGFACGVESLDRYLKTQAGQDMRRRASGVFVMVAADAPETIIGYYTLAATALPPGDVPEAARKHLPRYPLASATLVGRLAVASERQGDRLGALLLADALQGVRKCRHRRFFDGGRRRGGRTSGPLLRAARFSAPPRLLALGHADARH